MKGRSRSLAGLHEPLGAAYLEHGSCRFLVWAPSRQKVELRITSPIERTVPLIAEERGYHRAVVEGVEVGSRYLYRLDDELERPDPASRYQPEGVHGPSQMVDPGNFRWDDAAWTGCSLEELVTYELHVGTFTPEGTFGSTISCLDELSDLGITAVEIMPIAQFPGSRNWGYDGVYPYAVHNTYGGPHGFKELVNECHRRRMAVVLDVVYNHLGPEGNYLGDFGPYFSEKYQTPWGKALNYDGPHSDEVRRFFIASALRWFQEFHVDALRLDAIHGIFDMSARPFLQELAEETEALSARLERRFLLIAESDLNDSRVASRREVGGFGLDAQWADDFHHSVHTLLTAEQTGYYRDFGEAEHLATALNEGWIYSGQYSPYRRRRYGNSPASIPSQRFVVAIQNHDQVGNRLLGERLSALASFEQLKLGCGVLLLSPFIPLLFMGEEYGESSPFQFFIDHSDLELIEMVRKGRREEFVAFGWSQEPPDPYDEKTFARSKLRRELRLEPKGRALMELYRELIRLRKELPPLALPVHEPVRSWSREKVVFLLRRSAADEALAIFNFGDDAFGTSVDLPGADWKKRIDSAEPRWQGPGSLLSETIPANAIMSLQTGSFALLIRGRDALA